MEYKADEMRYKSRDRRATSTDTEPETVPKQEGGGKNGLAEKAHARTHARRERNEQRRRVSDWNELGRKEGRRKLLAI